ncbi:hypothetical protein OF83DRAFT_1098441 [Amylostereum chailletii]|nr:hypothetical protein OF83DRAFT_1098441 [Amylostereum chailletii]
MSTVYFLAVLFLGAVSTTAQIVAPTGCVDSFNWTSNSLGQTPCIVAAYLLSACNGGSFTIEPLQPGNAYGGPTGSDRGDVCKCNSVAYSTISACSACQSRSWVPWDTWSGNCSNVASIGQFPVTIPSETRVPHWALQNVTQTGIWDSQTALNAGGMLIDLSTPTRLTIMCTDLPEEGGPSGSSSSSRSHTGAIAGGVVGGVVGLALIVGLAWFLIRRHRLRASDYHNAPPSVIYNASLAQMRDSDHMSSTVGHPSLMQSPMKLYNPADPSTFPDTAAASSLSFPGSPEPPSSIHTTLHPNYHPEMGYDQDMPRNTQYRGLPEV